MILLILSPTTILILYMTAGERYIVMVSFSLYGLFSTVLAYLYYNKFVTVDPTYYCRFGNNDHCKSLISLSKNQ